MILIPESGALLFKKGITVDFEWSGVAPNRMLQLVVKGIRLNC